MFCGCEINCLNPHNLQFCEEEEEQEEDEQEKDEQEEDEQEDYDHSDYF